SAPIRFNFCLSVVELLSSEADIRCDAKSRCFGLGVIIRRILLNVCSVAQSGPSWLEIRTLALNDRFHQQRTFSKV
ncbi:MAG: hypothetical protein ABJR23_14985, partial [Paracoccaceae bacterium]